MGARLVQEATDRFGVRENRMGVDQDQALLAMNHPHMCGKIDKLLAKEVKYVRIVTFDVKESAHVVGEQVARRFAIYHLQ